MSRDSCAVRWLDIRLPLVEDDVDDSVSCSDRTVGEGDDADGATVGVCCCLLLSPARYSSVEMGCRFV
ncbi:hypothetical protein ELS19_20090 [Halogeometricum borinquense]|uniref:Uncharacterized protein n=1 Tax=Halogeometricum borinquense TaxID=60847 RepID=A0A482SXX0_9EURY|nr:hypothetical protein [Halogeometricum borinquense]RYJ07731.1 hypothetical protein ELS19_20090 [Halogeometricum borinquense]